MPEATILNGVMIKGEGFPPIKTYNHKQVVSWSHVTN